MKLRFARVAQVCVAAIGCAFASLLAFGVSAAAAVPYFVPGRPVTDGSPPATTTLGVLVAVAVVIAFAGIVFLALRYGRSAASSETGSSSVDQDIKQTREVDSLTAEHHSEQTRKAA